MARRFVALGAAGVTLCALAAVPLVSHADSCSPEWASFQHDASHSGSNCSSIDVVTATALHPAWFQPTSGAVTAEPAVANGVVYVGDGDGTFYAFDAASGAVKWTRNLQDGHSPSYGWITSSAAVDDGVVYIGAGGTVWALDADDGQVVWSHELAPGAADEEVESSPVVWHGPGALTEVIVGDDVNEDRQKDGGPAVPHTGVFALDAGDGHVLWAYDPQDDRRYNGPLPSSGNNGCADVWGSPVVDSVTAQVFFPIGNCNVDNSQRLTALDAISGTEQWSFAEPAANHGPDDDFGSSPIVVHGLGLVVQAGKSGWVYGVKEAPGPDRGAQLTFQVHAAEWGHAVVTSLGGFIATGATGTVGGHPVFFGNSAIPVPFADNDPQDGPDASLATDGDPRRRASLHAVDLATGTVLWHGPQPPSYAPVTFSNGLVFAPSTTGFDLNVFEASTGALLKSVPLAAAPSGGVTVSGDSIYFGTGTYFAAGSKVPPQNTGVWSFTTAPVS